MKTHNFNLVVMVPTKFIKPARLIEKVTSHPEEVLEETFSQTPLEELLEYFLPNWLRVALINTNSPYSGAADREVLCEFYDHLLHFVKEAFLSSIYTNTYEFKGLNKNIEDNPCITVSNFFKKFSIEYIRRELADFLEAGIGYEGNYPNGFTPWQAWLTYNNIQCLTEAAYQLHLNQQQNFIAIESVS